MLHMIVVYATGQTRRRSILLRFWHLHSRINSRNRWHRSAFTQNRAQYHVPNWRNTFCPDSALKVSVISLVCAQHFWLFIDRRRLHKWSPARISQSNFHQFSISPESLHSAAHFWSCAEISICSSKLSLFVNIQLKYFCTIFCRWRKRAKKKQDENVNIYRWRSHKRFQNIHFHVISGSSARP